VLLVFVTSLRTSAGQSLALGRLNAGPPSIRAPDLQVKVPGGYSSTWEDDIEHPAEDRPLGIAENVPYRDYTMADNSTESCDSHWRVSYLISVCSKSQSAHQLVTQLRHAAIRGEKIRDYMGRVFKAVKPQEDKDVVTYDVQEGEYMCLNRTWSPTGQYCECGCDRVLRLHFSMEIPLDVSVDEVGVYLKDTVMAFLNSFPGVCASEVDTADMDAVARDMEIWEPYIAHSSTDPLPDVRFGNVAKFPSTFQRTIVSPWNLSPIMQSSTCRHADWRTSFDTMGWSTCAAQSNLYLNGLYRSKWGRDTTSEAIAMLDRAQCCEAPLMYKDMPAAYRISDWSSSFKREGWSLCPNGYYLNGLYRFSHNSTAGLQDIESARCAKPANHPLHYSHCYDEDISEVFNSMGWASCSKSGYYISGLYRNENNQLRDIDRMRCCSMMEEHGSQPDLVQDLPHRAFTASTCPFGADGREPHRLLGKECNTRGHFSHCMKFKAPRDCVMAGLLLGDPPLVSQSPGNGPFAVVDLGQVRHVGHGVLFGRGDRDFDQKVTRFQVFGMVDAAGPWEQIGGVWDSQLAEFGRTVKDQGTPFVVNRNLRYLKVQAVECHKHCTTRLQLFEHSVMGPEATDTNGDGSLVHSNMQQASNRASARTVEMWSCPQ